MQALVSYKGVVCSPHGLPVPSQDRRRAKELHIILLRSVRAGEAAAVGAEEAAVGVEEAAVGVEEAVVGVVEVEAAEAGSHEIQPCGKDFYSLFYDHTLFFWRMLSSADGSVNVDVIGRRKFGSGIYTGRLYVRHYLQSKLFLLFIVKRKMINQVIISIHQQLSQQPLQQQ